MTKISLFKALLLLILGCSSLVNASTNDSNMIFNWAEYKYTELFQPKGAETIDIQGYTARYYEDTNTYLGTKDGQIYAYGDIFGGLLKAGSVEEVLSQVNLEQEQYGNMSGSALSFTVDGAPLIDYKFSILSGANRDYEIRVNSSIGIASWNVIDSISLSSSFETGERNYIEIGHLDLNEREIIIYPLSDRVSGVEYITISGTMMDGTPFETRLLIELL